MTTTEEKAETPPRLFEAGELPKDPAAEVQPGDWFAMHLVCRPDGQVAVTADVGWMPAAEVLAGLDALRADIELAAVADAEIRSQAERGQEKYEALIAQGMSTDAAKVTAMIDIIKEIHSKRVDIEQKIDEKKNDNGDETSPAT